MHAQVMHAKKKALAELIRQMRRMEAKGSVDADQHPSGPVDMEPGENDVMEPDMSDLEDTEGALGEDLDDDNEDPKAELEQFMKKGAKKGGHKPRATVIMAIKKSPVAQMKKTFATSK